MKNKWLIGTLLFFTIILKGYSQEKFNGVDANLSNIFRLSDAKSRSISPENFNGEKGKGGMAVKGTGESAARDLGQGWKVSPCIEIKPHTTYTVAEIDGSGSIQHIWMTPTGVWRNSIIRFYWDDEKTPSIEAPVGDFFGMGWGQYSSLRSLAVCVNPGSAFNCYWPMPFRKKCRITMENIDNDPMTLFYQVDYILTEISADAAYFHAQFRRVNPLPEKSVFVVLDGIQGRGQYVGTYLAWGVHNNGW
ncbi:MAG TPA: glycoside hydrolase family 172 protein, partial [Puia sp.]|nr:glycoside hydrolase family 172 protein [Puia sp.]